MPQIFTDLYNVASIGQSIYSGSHVLKVRPSGCKSMALPMNCAKVEASLNSAVGRMVTKLLD